MPRALAAFFTFERRLKGLLDSGRVSKPAAGRLLDALKRVDSVLGVMEFEPSRAADQGADSSAIAELVAQREDARARKDFTRADEIRDDLRRRGVTVEDTPSGPVWHRLSTSA